MLFGSIQPLFRKRDAELFFIKRDLFDVLYRSADHGVAVEAVTNGCYGEGIGDEPAASVALDLLVEGIGGLDLMTGPFWQRPWHPFDDLRSTSFFLPRLPRAETVGRTGSQTGSTAAAITRFFWQWKVSSFDCPLRLSGRLIVQYRLVFSSCRLILLRSLSFFW